MSTTAPFLQLDAVCTMVASAIRNSAELAAAFGVSNKDLCAAVIQRKAFDAKDEGASVYTTQMPCLAIFPSKSARAYVRGGPGMETTLGIQYLFKQPVHADNFEAMERVNRALHLMWWVICDALQAPNAVTAAGLADTISADEASYLGPMDDGTCGLDGSGVMTYRQPPYFVAEMNDLITIHGDIDLNTIGGDVTPGTPEVPDLMQTTVDNLNV